MLNRRRLSRTRTKAGPARPPHPDSILKRGRITLLAAGLIILALHSTWGMAATPPEKWLPDDTLGFVTARDPGSLRALLEGTTQGMLWQDPALKPFRDKLTEGWQRDFVKPLERELDLEFKTWTAMIKGPVVLALIQGDPAARDDAGAGWVLAADTTDKAPALKKELGGLRQRWLSGGKQARIVQVREQEFIAVTFDTNSPLDRLRRLLPRVLETQELGTRMPTNPPPSRELLIGQSGSLLILSSSTRSLEKVMLRLGGGAAPVVEGQAAYDICHKRLFTAAPVYGWVNTRACLAIYSKPGVRETSGPAPPAPVDVLDKAKLVQASGLGALRAAGFAFSQSTEGIGLELLLNVPEAERQGVFKILAGEPKPCDIPTFVPADVAEFQRWRIDGQKAWATIENMMSEISPQWLSAINFILDTANQAAQFKDPGFDVRKNLVANIGDDIITYSKVAKGSETGGAAGGSLLMVSSPNPGQLAAALQRVLIFMSAEAETPAQREFLGRLIYSVPLPAVPMPLGEPSTEGGGRTLHYSATSSYVVLSTDVALLEEQLRSAESHAPGLKDNPSLMAAARRVTGPGTSMFAYENQALLERATFEATKAGGTQKTNFLSKLNSLSWAGFIAPEEQAREWIDLSLLPPFDRVAKYFHFSVRGTSASPEGVSISWFYPVPPVLRQETAAKN